MDEDDSPVNCDPLLSSPQVNPFDSPANASLHDSPLSKIDSLSGADAMEIVS